jgi:hypothetical protein
MNIGFIVCLVMGGLFSLFAIIFALLKEKGAMLISGFNTLPKEERENYNKIKMSKDMRHSFLIWSAVFAIGAILSYVISSYIAIASLIVWLILFFKDVHIDTEKAFGKYRL